MTNFTILWDDADLFETRTKLKIADKIIQFILLNEVNRQLYDFILLKIKILISFSIFYTLLCDINNVFWNLKVGNDRYNSFHNQS